MKTSALVILGLLATGVSAMEAQFSAAAPAAIALGEVSAGPALAAKSREYGEAELIQLVAELRGTIERELGRAGRLAEPDQAGATLVVVIEDATPNRPTAQQQVRVPRPLDPRSVSVGGARVSARLLAPDGSQLATFKDEYQTRPDITRSEYAVVWTDAHRAFDRFARGLAQALESEGAEGR